MHHRQQRGEQHDVRQQNQVRYQSEDLVVKRHEREHAGHADLERQDTFIDVVAAEAWTHCTLFHRINHSCQRSGTQQERKVARLSSGQARDLEAVTEHTADRRVVDYLLVGDIPRNLLSVDFRRFATLLDQDHGHVMIHIGTGCFQHGIASAGVELDVYRRPLLRLAGGCARELVAGCDDFALQEDRTPDTGIRIQLRAERNVPARLCVQRIVLLVLEPKLERRHAAENVLHFRGILHTRELDVDAVQALALNDRLGDSELVDPIAQRRDVLLDGIVLAVANRRRRNHGRNGCAARQALR